MKHAASARHEQRGHCHVNRKNRIRSGELTPQLSPSATLPWLGCRGTRLLKSSTGSTKKINAGLNDPKVVVRFASLGTPVLSGSAADFGTLIADQTEKWGR